MYRYMPVHLFDLEGVEAWLTEQGEKGYFPKEGDSTWICSFRRGEPSRVRYQLEPLEHRDDGPPDEEELAVYKESGWRYVKTISKMYHIFAAERPDAVDLHTDPVTEAYALKGLTRRCRVSFLWSFIWVAVCIAVIAGSFFQPGGIVLQLADGSMLALLVAAALMLMSSVEDAVHTAWLLRRRKFLRSGKELPRRARKARPWWRSAGKIILTCLAAAVLIFYWVRRFGGLETAMELADYQELAYPSLSQLAEQEQCVYTPEDFPFEGINWLNAAEIRWENLAKVTEIRQTGTAQGRDLRMDISFYQLYIPGWENALQESLAEYFAVRNEYGYETQQFDPAAGEKGQAGQVQYTWFENQGRFFLFASRPGLVMALRYSETSDTEGLPLLLDRAQLLTSGLEAMEENAEK